MKINKKITNSKKKQLVNKKLLSKKHLSKKHLSKKHISKKHLTKKHLTKNKHKKVNILSQYGSSHLSGWHKPQNRTSTNQISTINDSSQPFIESEMMKNPDVNGESDFIPIIESEMMKNQVVNGKSDFIHIIESEMEKNQVVNGKYHVYIISIGCAPRDDKHDLKQIYGDDISFEDRTNIEPHLIIIDLLDKESAAKTLKYINSPPISQVFAPENIILFNMLLPTDGKDPIYSSLSRFVNQFNGSNGCVIVRNFIRFRNIDYDLGAERASQDEITKHLIYKILYEKVFLQQSSTPNKLLLRWFGYTENEKNILKNFQYCLFIETNNDKILTNSADNDKRLLRFLQDRKNEKGSYRQDSINITPITPETEYDAIHTSKNLDELQKIESTIDKWKPIPFNHDKTSKIQNVINNELSTINKYYQDISQLKNKPIPSLFRDKIQNVPTTINLPQIMITSNGLLPILQI